MTIGLAGRRAWAGWWVCVAAGLAWLNPASAQEAAKDPALAWCEKARTLAKASKLVEADNAFRDAVKAFDEQAAQHGNEAPYWARYYQCLNEQASHWAAMERFADAEKHFKHTLFVLPTLQAKKFPGDPALQLTWAKTHNGLADLYRAMERSMLAVKEYGEALTVLRKLVQQNPAERAYRRELAEVLNRYGLEEMKQARFREAELAYREELQIWHNLVQEQPNAPEYRVELAKAYNAYGSLTRESGRYLQARDLIRSAIQVVQPLMDAFPTQPEHWRYLPVFYRNLAVTLDSLHIHAEKAAAVAGAERCDEKLASLPRTSAPTYTEGDLIFTCLRRHGIGAASAPGEDMETLLAKAEKQVQASPNVPAYRSQSAAAKIVLATHWTTGHIYDKALTYHREALAASETLVKEFPELPMYRRLQASALTRLGTVHFVKDDPKEGEKCVLAAYAIYRKLADDYPDEPTFRRVQDEEMDPLMRFMLERGDNAKALDIMRMAINELKKLVAEHPACPQFRIFYAIARQSEGHMHGRLKNDKGAEEAFLASIQLWSQTIVDFPHTVEFHACQLQSKSYLLQLYNRQKRWADAEALVREMLPTRQKLIDAAPQMACFHSDLAVDHAWLATLATEQGRPDQALENFNRSLTLCEKAFAMQPSERTYLLLLRESYRARGEVHQQGGNFAAYQSDQQRGRELAEWLDTPFVRLTRIRQRLEDGKADLARRETDDLFAGIELTGAQWYDLAGIYARLTKTNDAAQREHAATCAVASLKNALQKGYQPLMSFGEEEQFRPLFARTDFRQLLPVRPAGK